MANYYGGKSTSGAQGAQHLDVFIPELWADALKGYVEANLLVKNMCGNDYSSLVAQAGDTVHIPFVGDSSVSNVSHTADSDGTGDFTTDGGYTTGGIDAVTYQADSELKLQLSINKHKYSARMFEDLGMIQSKGQLFQKYVESMGYALAKQIDSDFITELKTIPAGQQISLDTAGEFDEADLKESVLYLEKNNIDSKSCSVILSPTLYYHMLGVAGGSNAFVDYNLTGQTSGKISGSLGMIYGMNAFVTTQLQHDTDDTTSAHIGGFIVKNDCLAYGMAQDIRVQSDYSIDHLSTKVVADVAYGVKLINGTADTRNAGVQAGVALINP